jgi:hypothetical protein
MKNLQSRCITCKDNLFERIEEDSIRMGIIKDLFQSIIVNKMMWVRVSQIEEDVRACSNYNNYSSFRE